MKGRADVTSEKLRGGFYTPPALVDACLARVDRLTGGQRRLAILEPSAGDGAFVRRLGRRAERVVAVEPHETEAAKCRQALRDARISGSVIVDSALAWALETNESFDAAIGNPPFVRFQFVTPKDVRLSRELGYCLGVDFGGVSNLWIPVLIAALARLRPGGAFAFVVPSESMTGLSARLVRRWLALNAIDLRLDLFRPNSFPGVLQEVVVLSGRIRKRRSDGSAKMELSENGSVWSHKIEMSGRAWTRYLLRNEHIDALDTAAASSRVAPLGLHARFEVSIVTGANDYFCVDRTTCERFELHRWTKPLLPRIRMAPGLRFTCADRSELETLGAKAWLLDFAADAPDPRRSVRPRAYLSQAWGKGIPERYKCRIREPWFRIPGIRKGDLLLSKRSHAWPRVVANESGAYTTDTIYRGAMIGASPISRADLVACFHNSLTLLSAELEGRSFGGGVLELVPSEIGRIVIPVAPGIGRYLRSLDTGFRADGGSSLVASTNALIAGAVLEPDLLAVLEEARMLLQSRRLQRNRAARASSQESQLDYKAA